MERGCGFGGNFRGFGNIRRVSFVYLPRRRDTRKLRLASDVEFEIQQARDVAGETFPRSECRLSGPMTFPVTGFTGVHRLAGVLKQFRRRSPAEKFPAVNTSASNYHRPPRIASGKSGPISLQAIGQVDANIRPVGVVKFALDIAAMRSAGSLRF